MLKLEDIKKNAVVVGIEPGQVVHIVTTESVGLSDDYGALTVYYKTLDGTLRERMLFRTDETTLSLAEAGRPWAFDASGEAFKLAAEAYRINLAHLFDPMMAVHTSNVEPLPHQPMRYVLADDPGAGKTIMAGLFIRELLMRADARRVLIVAPGSRSSSPGAATPSTTLICLSPVSINWPVPTTCRRSYAGPTGIWWWSTKLTSSPPATSATRSTRPSASSWVSCWARSLAISCS